jgi:predicted P-loop ATPase
VTTLAKQNPFNPVKHYLDDLWLNAPPQLDGEPSTIEQLGKEVLGLQSPLELVYLKKFLVGAVARAMHPGCKLDILFVLLGGQGMGKTTFFQNLFGLNWFATMGEVANEREELMTFHQHWCSEYGEFETAAGKKAVSAMKNFLSRQKDSYREPYGREPLDHLRAFILCGTSNETEFLNDPTGNRRFWVAALTKKVDQAWVLENRDALWLEAVQLYKAKYTWWLNDEEQRQQEEVTKAHSIKSEAHDLIMAWLQGEIPINGTSFDKYKPGEGFTTTHILDKVLPQNQNRKQAEMEASKVLKSLGFTKKRARKDGALVYLWTGSPNCLDELDTNIRDVPKQDDICEDF